jgi:ABC-2 type transport system permease protein
VRRALIVEWWKMRRSRVTATATLLMGILLPAMGLGFYKVALSEANGILADKAGAFLVAEGWEGYLGLVDQIAAVAMLLGAGIVVAWVFGREHVDRTFPSLFALPISRRSMATAKFVVLVCWLGLLAAVVCCVAFLLGWVGDVGPINADVLASGLSKLFFVGAGAGALALTLGWVASIGRGYLPAIGVLIVIIAASQVAVLFGTGGWFPFAIPGLLAVSASEEAPALSAIQMALVPAIALAAIWLTVRWWETAEVS